jgi:hypothetical protein
VERDEVLEFLSDDRPSWCPENQALTNFFIDVKQLQVLSEFSVISLLCFLKSSECGSQGFF